MLSVITSKLASQITDDKWASQRHIMLILTKVILLVDGVNEIAQDGCDGAPKVVFIDWNSIEVEEHTDLIIAPMTDIEMTKMFGIPIDDRDKEKKSDETNMSTNAERNSFPEDVDAELIQEAADDVDDTHDDELVNLHDKENTIIDVGRIRLNMDEFRMCFKTYAVKIEFDAKTLWTERKKKVC
jgi:hypothetical protein